MITNGLNSAIPTTKLSHKNYNGHASTQTLRNQEMATSVAHLDFVPSVHKQPIIVDRLNSFLSPTNELQFGIEV